MSVKLEEKFREAAPIHLLFKIDSFSMLSKNSIHNYDSNEFETGGYQWKLSLYPEGNEYENGGEGHISLYLMLVNDSTSSLHAGWELNVFFKLFLFDQIRDRYLFQGDMEGKTRRFHDMKKMWGFPQFVSLEKFYDPKNGYLVDDTCVFGAEVFIAKPPGNFEYLSMVKLATTINHKWKIEKFPEIKEYLWSEKFEAADHNWDLIVYPKGNFEGKNNSVSLYLRCPDCEKDPGLKVFTDIKIRIRDEINGNHIEFSAENHWFDGSSSDWGWPKFIGLGEMMDKEKGYLVNDTCIVEAEVKELGLEKVHRSE